MVLFVRTIDSDEEVEHVSSSSEEEEEIITNKKKLAVKKMQKKSAESAVINPDFEFDDRQGDDFGNVQVQQSWDFEAAIKSIEKTEHPSQRNTTTLDVKIQHQLEVKKAREEKLKRKKANQAPPQDDDESGDETDGDDQSSEDDAEEGTADAGSEDEAGESSGEEEEEAASGAEEEETASGEEDEKSDGQSEDEDASGDEQEEEEAQDVQNVIKKPVHRRDIKANQQATVAFSQLNLSRPLLRAVKALGFQNPTPIQARAIPSILLGKDVCGSAVTGSGKTAAYLLPILERLLFRPKKIAATRVLVITPTRELAQQVLSMLEKLAQFTDITAISIVGGLSLQVQASQLRGRPDVVVCTPGRLIDHLRNTQSVDLDDCEILVLDEADRLLELGFKDEIAEVVKFCPKQRQTILFSATMTNQVDELANISLNKPVRIAADPLHDMAQRLVQEFLRIRDTRECDREAILLALCRRSFQTETIVFFRRKSQAHRMGILFGLCGLKATELHGNLTQRQRLEALQKFRDGQVDFLLCTDLASRGLDIQGVRTVINYEMPRDMTTYVHRVGRTARAGRGGISVTLTGERQRKIMKEVLKRSKQNVKSRQVPQGVVDKCREEIESLEQDIRGIYQQEKIEKECRLAEMEATKTSNIITHMDEITSRPQRTWFQSERQKKAIKEASKEASLANDNAEALNAKERRKAARQAERKAEKEKVPHRMNRKKRRRMELLAGEEEDRKRALKEAAESADADGRRLGDKEVKQLSVPLETKVLVGAKKAKKKQREEESAALEKVLAKKHRSDDDNTPKKRKVGFGGASVFDNDLNPGGALSAIDSRLNKKKKKGKEEDFVFKEKDITKSAGLRKGGKLGNKKFKSRKKFKRR